MDVDMMAISTHGWWNDLDESDADYNYMMLVGTLGWFSQALVVDLGNTNLLMAWSSITTEINEDSEITTGFNFVSKIDEDTNTMNILSSITTSINLMSKIDEEDEIILTSTI